MYVLYTARFWGSQTCCGPVFVGGWSPFWICPRCAAWQVYAGAGVLRDDALGRVPQALYFCWLRWPETADAGRIDLGTCQVSVGEFPWCCWPALVWPAVVARTEFFPSQTGVVVFKTTGRAVPRKNWRRVGLRRTRRPLLSFSPGLRRSGNFSAPYFGVLWRALACPRPSCGGTGAEPVVFFGRIFPEAIPRPPRDVVMQRICRGECQNDFV